MIYSGLDWSGDAGRATGGNPWLVIAVVHVDRSDLPLIDAGLAGVRKALRLPPNYPFKHQGAAPATQRMVFEEIGSLPITAHVHVIDKQTWTRIYVGTTRGDDRIRDGIVELVLGCPRPVVAKQMLYVDLPRTELRLVKDQRTAIRQALNVVGRASFNDVRPCPDDGHFGQVIQIADMLAGEVREFGGMTGPHLGKLVSKVRII